MSSETSPKPSLLWESGTAYDLFASLVVLLHPERFGLRGSWAAGVRSRLPAAERKFLESIQEVFFIPLRWLYQLPAPKDAATALWALGQLTAIERVRALFLYHETPAEIVTLLERVSLERSWSEADRTALCASTFHRVHPLSPKAATILLDGWADPQEFSEKALAALKAYQTVFFAEEERHILPHLQAALARAQQLAGEMDAPALLEELSQGVQFTFWSETQELALSPCYWMTPLVSFGQVSPGRMLVLFGARPAEVSIVPGEVIPEAMLRGLKALADPTRLRVLRYLAVEPLTPSQLSRKLRLRAPTVVHHLNALRLAGLVRLTVEAEGEKRYAIRSEAVSVTFSALQRFLEEKD